MNEVQKAQLLSALRTTLAAIGGYAVGQKWVSQETLDLLLNHVLPVAVMVGVAVWGMRNARKSEEKAVVREAVAVNAGAALASGDGRIEPPVPAARVPEVIQTYRESPAAEQVKAEAKVLAKGKEAK